MPIRRRKKRNKSPKVVNFSNIEEGIETGIVPFHTFFTLFYAESDVFGQFGEFWQKKTSWAIG
jgi:hypothetical protein